MSGLILRMGLRSGKSDAMRRIVHEWVMCGRSVIIFSPENPQGAPYAIDTAGADVPNVPRSEATKK